jgi:hypothetical protein
MKDLSEAFVGLVVDPGDPLGLVVPGSGGWTVVGSPMAPVHAAATTAHKLAKTTTDSR